MKIIVGIGNPGRQYAGTRHNAGYRVIENLAQKLSASAGRERFESIFQEAMIGGEKVILMRPLTYMNLSGMAVRRAVDWYDCPVQDVLLVCDDLNLPVAAIRVRASGRSGGHNGLQSVIDHLGATDFPRLRIGIGSPPPHVEGADYVLSRPPGEENALLEVAFAEAADAAILWVKRGIAECMNEYNRKAATDQPDGDTPA
ncbi:MAG TPA: aminoacyl-tRNA hydrolase [Planctomycetota bacterium]|nr:aminoacyl-tRNA hydrolase [Planctomycetota bacterium]